MVNRTEWSPTWSEIPWVSSLWHRDFLQISFYLHRDRNLSLEGKVSSCQNQTTVKQESNLLTRMITDWVREHRIKQQQQSQQKKQANNNNAIMSHLDSKFCTIFVSHVTSHFFPRPDSSWILIVEIKKSQLLTKIITM